MTGPFKVSRRTTLTTLSAAAAASAMPALGRPVGPASDMFRHGVASGDPDATSVVLWTRISGVEEATVAWEVASDPGFRKVAASGQFATGAERDFTVKALAEGRTSFYTSPIKALASEKFFSLCDELGAANVGMLTGDAAINRDAPIICCTAEILANDALRYGADARVDDVVEQGAVKGLLGEVARHRQRNQPPEQPGQRQRHDHVPQQAVAQGGQSFHAPSPSSIR